MWNQRIRKLRFAERRKTPGPFSRQAFESLILNYGQRILLILIVIVICEETVVPEVDLEIWTEDCPLSLFPKLLLKQYIAALCPYLLFDHHRDPNNNNIWWGVTTKLVLRNISVELDCHHQNLQSCQPCLEKRLLIWKYGQGSLTFTSFSSRLEKSLLCQRLIWKYGRPGSRQTMFHHFPPSAIWRFEITKILFSRHQSHFYNTLLYHNTTILVSSHPLIQPCDVTS